MQIYTDIEQGSEEWLKLRGGVITGTKLKGVMGGPKAQETQIYELIGEEFAPLEVGFKNSAMERGIELEPIAKAKYEDITNQKVEEVGFIKSDKYKDDFGSWLGLSPDGIIKIDNVYKKAVEIKCVGAKNHTKYIIENKIPDDYKNQVLTYFLVMEDLEELDFVIFNPDFYIKEKQLFTIRITREELQKDLEKAEDKIIEFRKKWLENINIITK